MFAVAQRSTIALQWAPHTHGWRFACIQPWSRHCCDSRLAKAVLACVWHAEDSLTTSSVDCLTRSLPMHVVYDGLISMLWITALLELRSDLPLV